MKSHIHYDVFISIATILLGLFFLATSVSFPNDTGLFPRIFSMLLVVCSAFVLFSGIRNTRELNRKAAAGEQPELDFTGQELLQTVLGFLILVAYVACVGFLGFFTSTAIFLVAFMYFLHMRNWKIVIPVTVGVVLVVYFVFVIQLQVALPRGLLI